MGGRRGCFGEEEGGGYGGAADVVAEGCEEGSDVVGGGTVVGHHCLCMCLYFLVSFSFGVFGFVLCVFVVVFAYGFSVVSVFSFVWLFPMLSTTL